MKETEAKVDLDKEEIILRLTSIEMAFRAGMDFKEGDTYHKSLKVCIKKLEN